ncbi:MAG: hypothetical protein EAZ30_04420 [Betaproteobacteria bacterium]|nr:MAG: hypothetical protein EAZ30_04420 [Betaproteobacteria bacterium]
MSSVTNKIAILVKLNTLGDQLWMIRDVEQQTRLSPIALAVNDANEVLVTTAQVRSALDPVTDWAISKYRNSDGTRLWRLPVVSNTVYGGRPSYIRTHGGLIYVSGFANRAYPDLSDDWQLAKINDGIVPTLSWKDTYANTGNNWVNGFALSANGDVATIVGETIVSGGRAFSALIYSNLNSQNPTVRFASKLGTGSTFGDAATDAAVTADSKIYVVGSLGVAGQDAQPALVKFDASGVEHCSWIDETSSGQYRDGLTAITLGLDGPVVTGAQRSSLGSVDMVTIQFDSQCRRLWTVRHGEPQTREYGLAIKTLSSGPHAGRVITAGWGRSPMKPNTATLQAIDRVGCTLDVDGDGSRRALTDGLHLIKAMLDIAPANVISAETERATNLARSFVYRLDLDLDGDGAVRAESDGIILIRAMLGFRDDAITSGVAVSATAPRKQWLATTNPSSANSIKLFLARQCGGL